MKIDFEKVLAEYGLKVGDKIRFINRSHIDKDSEFEIIGGKRFYLKCGVLELAVIDYLGEFEWEKVEPKKKVGDMNCNEINCTNCPLYCIHCEGNSFYSVRERWVKAFEKYPQLEPMHDYIEKELDKEVEE